METGAIDLASPNGTLIGLIGLGGPVVAILCGISVILLALVLVKLWQFQALQVGRHALARRMLAAWLRGDQIDGRLAPSNSPTAQILLHAIRGATAIRAGQTDIDAVREDLERVAATHLLDLRRYLRALDAIAQIAPLLGLFGTVLGMIEAFQSLQAAGTQVDPSTLAGGIWVALLTTAFGLAIAMPASLCHAWFESRIAREQMAMEDMATSVLTGRITEQTPRPAIVASAGA